MLVSAGSVFHREGSIAESDQFEIASPDSRNGDASRPVSRLLENVQFRNGGVT